LQLLEKYAIIKLSQKGVFDVFELILMVFVGLLFLFLGWSIWKKEQITLIHSYHYQKVSEENKKDYTEEMGKSIIFIGIGILLTGIIDFITRTSYGWLFFTIFFILGFVKIFKAQKKYNNGMF